MAEFTVSGQRGGAPVSVTWRDGVVMSDDQDATAAWIRHLAALREGAPLRYGAAPATLHDHLQSPYSACGLIRSVFAGPVTQDRPLPPLDLPPDAIA